MNVFIMKVENKKKRVEDKDEKMRVLGATIFVGYYPDIFCVIPLS